jgi:hypothetical protein
LYDGGSFVSQTARGHLEEDQALVALELAHGGHYRREMDVETATAAEPTCSFASRQSSKLRHRLFIEYGEMYRDRTRVVQLPPEDRLAAQRYQIAKVRAPARS